MTARESTAVPTNTATQNGILLYRINVAEGKLELVKIGSRPAASRPRALRR